MSELEVLKFASEVGERVIGPLTGQAQVPAGATGCGQGLFDDVQKILAANVAGAGTQEDITPRMHSFKS